MLLTIFNLPSNTRYMDVRNLIQTKCGFREVILDNLTQDSENTKKITVGLAEEEDAAILVRKINGMFVEGQQLYIETIKKKLTVQDNFYKMTPFELRQKSMQTKMSQPPPPLNIMDMGSSQPLLQQPYYQQSKYQPNTQSSFPNMQQNSSLSTMSPFGMFSFNPNMTASYGYPQQMLQTSCQQMIGQSMTGYDQGAPLGFSNQGNESNTWSDQNDWKIVGNKPDVSKPFQRGRGRSRWDVGDSSSRQHIDTRSNSRQDRAPCAFEQDASRDASRSAPRGGFNKDAPSRDFSRDVSSRSFGREGPSRVFQRNAPSRDFQRDVPSRDFQRNAPSRDFQRNAPSRDFQRDAPPRDFRRDTPSRDFRRDAPYREPDRGGVSRDLGRDARSRDRPRDHDRNASRDHGRGRGRDGQTRGRSRDGPSRRTPARDIPNKRLEPSRAPVKRQSTPVQTPYGDHVTGMSQPMRNTRFSQPRDIPRTNPSWDKPQHKVIKADSNYVPVPKRPKKGVGFGQQAGDKQKPNFAANQNQPPAAPAKKKKPDNPERMLIRHYTWRQQLASLLAKEIMNNPLRTTDVAKEPLMKELKRTIRTRIDALVGLNLEIGIADMQKLYRENYLPASETELFDIVVEETKKNIEEADKANRDNKDGPPTQPPVHPLGDFIKIEAPDSNQMLVNQQGQQPNVPLQQQAIIPKPKQLIQKPKQPIQNPIKQEWTVPTIQQGSQPVMQQPTSIIPSYPLGDKKFNKEQKKTTALMFQDEDVLLSQMKPIAQKALHKEVNEILEEVTKDFEGYSDEHFNDYEAKVRNVVIDDCRKMLKLNLAKRIMNIGPIMLRIFNQPKMIARTKLAPVLARIGITSLRKSQKRKPPIYYGTCETYKVHDKLCSMEPMIVDGQTVTFKPFQLTGSKFGKTPKEYVKLNRNENWFSKDMSENLKQFAKDEVDNINDLGTDFDHDDDDEDQDETEVSEITETNDSQETSEVLDDDDTIGNVNLEPDEPPENVENGSDENSQITETTTLATESNSDDTQECVKKYVSYEEDKETDIDNQNNTEFDNGNKDEADNENHTVVDSKNNRVVDSENNTVVEKADIFTVPEIDNKSTKKLPEENVDFTVDVDIKKRKNSFLIQGKADHMLDMEESKKKEYFKLCRKKYIDEIDMADLNDDDLVDW